MRDQDRALFQEPWATRGHALSPGSKANEASSRAWPPQARTGTHDEPRDAPSAEKSVTPCVRLSSHYQPPTLVSMGHLPRNPNCTWHIMTGFMNSQYTDSSFRLPSRQADELPPLPHLSCQQGRQKPCTYLSR